MRDLQWVGGTRLKEVVVGGKINIEEMTIVIEIFEGGEKVWTMTIVIGEGQGQETEGGREAHT